MTTQIIPFAPKPVAERRKAVNAFNAALMSGVSAGGFPVLSIKGKVFHITRDGTRTLVTKPGEDDPAASLEVVLVAANANPSRVYYAKGYEEGSTEKPTCYSNDGKGPATDAASPQAKSCAACPHAQYGSKVSESGVKGWACSNSRRLAIAPVGQLNDPMLLRVPGASLKALAQYAVELDGHGYQFDEVVTKVGFDYSVAHPALTFKAIGILPPEAVSGIREVAASLTVQQIIGVAEYTGPTDEAEQAAQAATPALEKSLTQAEASVPNGKVKVEAPAAEEAAPAAQPAKKPAAKKAAEPVVSNDIDSGLDALLDGVNFDDE